METEISLIITIVNKGWGDMVLEASIKAGAEGGTILFGRGVGVHEHQKILGIPIEPEKEIVLSVIHSDQSEAILEEICGACKLKKPGAGMAFVIPVKKVVGVAHLFQNGSQLSAGESD